MIRLSDIECVLLDMDGTLLDKYFDDFFWEHLVPERYAEKHNVSFWRAKEVLMAMYRAHENTLNWTDIDFWSAELDLDIPALKEQIRHLIDIHPDVEDYLRMLRGHDKKVYMVTNAHYKVLDIKMKKIPLGHYFHRCITSGEIGCPKEWPEFWQKLENVLRFDKERTLLIDDTVAVLRTAKQYGIRHLLHKICANSKTAAAAADGFPVLCHFRDLIEEV
ncbi:MAG: putative hydrolase of the HAD superfamily [Nitrospirae bacterium]|nr:MAG: putative hydrolase of the HAD superfamily [Nitrospirota bacterium]